MKVTIERLPESRVQLDVEVDQERLEQALDAAYRRLAPKTRVPGFRPGKAPRAMVERHLGRDRLVSEALDRLVPDVYNEVIEQEDVDAIAQPHLDKVELDPVRLKFIVPVRPSVDLGDYRSIRVERKDVAVTDEMVEEQITLLRRRYAIHVPVERPATWNDVLTADVSGTADDEPFLNDEGAEFALREGQVLLMPGLAEAFVGMSKGEEKDVELRVPDDFRFESLRGKTAKFHIAVREVKEEQLPEANDELAAQVNAEEFPDFATLRARIVSDLEKALAEEESARLRSEAIDALVTGATIDYPNVLVEREIDHIIQGQMGNDQRQYAAYLARVGRSESQFRESLRPAAEQRLKRSLALSQLAEVEGIDVTPDEIEAEIDRLAEPMGEEAERFRQMFRTAQGISSIRNTLLSQKTLDRLVAIATGEAPEAPAAAPVGAAAESTIDSPAEEAAE